MSIVTRIRISHHLTHNSCSDPYNYMSTDRQLTMRAGPLVSTFQTMKYHRMLPKIALAAAFLSLLFSPVLSQSPSATPREEKLLNGLKLLMFNDPSSERVAVNVRVHAGSAFDPQGKEGLMKLLAANIFPNPEMREYFAGELGGNLSFNSNYDYIQIDASVKPDQLLTMLETVSSAVVNTPIDKETTAKLKATQLKHLEELSKDTSYLADQAAAARLLGTFPYGRPEDGTIASIQKIDFADLLDAKQRFFTADNATVILSGKFDQTLAYRAIRRYLGAWLKADKLVPSTFRQPDDPPTALLTVDSPVANRFDVRFITRGTSRGSADVYSYAIAANILETRFKSLAPAHATDIAVNSYPHVLPGTFVIAFSGISAQRLEAFDLISKAFGTPITEAEFQAAKQGFIANQEKTSVADRWLDVDTFKADIPSKERAKAAATTLADAQRILAKIQKQPMASIVVFSSKAAN